MEQLKLALARNVLIASLYLMPIAFDETVIDMLEEYRLNMRDKKHESKICSGDAIHFQGKSNEYLQGIF